MATRGISGGATLLGGLLTCPRASHTFPPAPSCRAARLGPQPAPPARGLAHTLPPTAAWAASAALAPRPPRAGPLGGGPSAIRGRVPGGTKGKPSNAAPLGRGLSIRLKVAPGDTSAEGGTGEAEVLTRWERWFRDWQKATAVIFVVTWSGHVADCFSLAGDFYPLRGGFGMTGLSRTGEIWPFEEFTPALQAFTLYQVFFYSPLMMYGLWNCKKWAQVAYVVDSFAECVLFVWAIELFSRFPNDGTWWETTGIPTGVPAAMFLALGGVASLASKARMEGGEGQEGA